MVEAESVKFVLRLPPGSHKRVKRSAKANNTSMNKEICNIIKGHYSKPDLEVQLDRIEAMLKKQLNKKKR